MDTYFASPERSERSDLDKSINIINNNPILNNLLQTVSGLLAILNRDRQILSYNTSFLELIGVKEPEKVLGLRFGEVIGCKYSDEELGGCGTSKYCKTCGLAIAQVTSLTSDTPVEKMCAIKVDRDGYERDVALKVKSQLIKMDDEEFILLFIQDITREQLKDLLNRSFFHDMKNLLTGIVGSTELLKTGLDDEELLKIIKESSILLNREIEMQSYLISEKKESLNLEYSKISLERIITILMNLFAHNSLVQNRVLEFENRAGDIEVYTDMALILRVLTNMIINALEAVPDGDKVNIDIYKENSNIHFSVKNSGVIEENIRLRIFQRNFSTKAEEGRGIGTFSMKLFGEKLLKGKVFFICNEQLNTTTFTLSLPEKSKKL